jgi:hypothetical protein
MKEHGKTDWVKFLTCRPTILIYILTSFFDEKLDEIQVDFVAGKQTDKISL